MKRIVPALLALAAAGAATAEPVNPKAVIKTDAGDITVELYPDQAPEAVKNFIALATGTKGWTDPNTGEAVTSRPLYNGTKFHRTIQDFMIQGGDPAGTGSGKVGFTLNKVEIAPNLRFDKPGRLAMANIGGNPASASSQFFITDVPTPHLDPNPRSAYTIFGQVVEGMEVVRKISTAPIIPGTDKPQSPVTIKVIEILESKTASADKATTGTK
jgi:peptidyl-prolyl cis-trans isomerase A (cyclophilin A)